VWELEDVFGDFTFCTPGPGNTDECPGISCARENIAEKIILSPLGQILALLQSMLQVKDFNACVAVSMVLCAGPGSFHHSVSRVSE